MLEFFSNIFYDLVDDNKYDIEFSDIEFPEESEEEVFEKAINLKYCFLKKFFVRWLEKEDTTEKFLKNLTYLSEVILGKLLEKFSRKEGLVFCIIGYGKMGAEELNFSSDIDIAFVHPLSIESERSTRFVWKFLNFLRRKSGRKFLWRIDLDLRPGGRASPVSVSDEFFLWYYTNLGTTDDRYALLRARSVGGRKEIGDELIAKLQPFIYRKYVDFASMERLKELKFLISKNLKRNDKIFNVKFSEGGIRDVEFILSATQLIYGGKDETIRSNSIIKTLPKIEKYVKENLLNPYIFLREIEIILQVKDEEQKFHIDEDDIPRLKRFFGEDFFDRLKFERDKVSKVFNEIFGDVEEDFKIITERDSIDDIEEYLRSLGFSEPKNYAKLVYEYLSKYTEKDLYPKVERIISGFILDSSKSFSPDESLSNFFSFLSSVGKRRGFYSILTAKPEIRRVLSNLFGFSPFFSNFLISHPELIDVVFLSSQISPDVPDLNEFWERVSSLDTEDVMNEIRRIKNEKILILMLEDFEKNLSIEEISSRIVKIYDFVLKSTFLLTQRETKEKNPPIIVLALGKYGSEEIIYGGDADLVFMFDDSPERSQRWIRFFQRFINFLTLRTKEGIGVEVDMRLRPSGRSGPLAISLKYAKDFYLEKEEEIWQRVALLKSRIIIGKEYESEVRDIIKKSFDNVDLKEYLLNMRRRTERELGEKDGKRNIKYCVGGLQDLEFSVHLLQVKAEDFSTKFIENIKKYLPMSLKDYFILRYIEKIERIRANTSDDVFFSPHIVKYLKFYNISIEDVEMAFKRNREVFEKIFS